MPKMRENKRNMKKREHKQFPERGKLVCRRGKNMKTQNGEMVKGGGTINVVFLWRRRRPKAGDAPHEGLLKLKGGV